MAPGGFELGNVGIGREGEGRPRRLERVLEPPQHPQPATKDHPDVDLRRRDDGGPVRKRHGVRQPAVLLQTVSHEVQHQRIFVPRAQGLDRQIDGPVAVGPRRRFDFGENGGGAEQRSSHGFADRAKGGGPAFPFIAT